MCGGTLGVAMLAAGADGLSPRVRGNRRGARPDPDGPGSIPACAGEPSHPGRPAAPSRVYPRVCGGTVWQVADRVLDGGLSPRVRGNRLEPHALGQALGSIPACAGEPQQSLLNRAAVRVYPRVCGGTHYAAIVADKAGGLSPRVRGNRCKPLPRRC